MRCVHCPSAVCVWGGECVCMVCMCERHSCPDSVLFVCPGRACLYGDGIACYPLLSEVSCQINLLTWDTRLTSMSIFLHTLTHSVTGVDL